MSRDTDSWGNRSTDEELALRAAVALDETEWVVSPAARRTMKARAASSAALSLGTRPSERDVAWLETVARFREVRA